MAAAVVLTVLTLVATACDLGTITRQDLEAKIQSRGGGFDQQLALDAAGTVGERVGTPDFEITSMNITPIPPTVTMRVRDPHDPNNLDEYTYRSGKLDDPKPVQLSATDNLGTQAFRVQSVALNKLNRVVDVALEKYASEGGYVTGVSIAGGKTPKIIVQLKSLRSTATATFDADGNLLTLERG